MLDPAWVTAGADLAIATEKGVAMIGKCRSKSSESDQAAEHVAIPQQVIPGQALIVSALIIAAAMLLAAGIIHHGLAA